MTLVWLHILRFDGLKSWHLKRVVKHWNEENLTNLATQLAANHRWWSCDLHGMSAALIYKSYALSSADCVTSGGSAPVTVNSVFTERFRSTSRTVSVFTVENSGWAQMLLFYWHETIRPAAPRLRTKDQSLFCFDLLQQVSVIQGVLIKLTDSFGGCWQSAHEITQ